MVPRRPTRGLSHVFASVGTMIWIVSEHCFFCGHPIGEDGCEACGTVRHARSERRVRAPCPRCGSEVRLVPFGIGDAALQACSRCKGMFVSAPDWDTLLDVFSQEPLPDVVVPDAEGSSMYGPYRSAPSSGAPRIDLEASVRCPTCEREMDRLEFAAFSRVIIDVCPDHGVWLDAGELERIIASVHPHPLPEPVAHAPVVHEPLPSFAEEVAEAAKEPITQRVLPNVTPDTDWMESMPPTRPVPAAYDRVERVPWTVQLGRALGHLVKMIVSR